MGRAPVVALLKKYQKNVTHILPTTFVIPDAPFAASSLAKSDPFFNNFIPIELKDIGEPVTNE